MADDGIIFCPGCGKQIQVGYNICPYCGRPVNQPQVQGPPMAGENDAKAKINEAVRARGQSDKLMEGSWFILIILSATLAFIGFLLMAGDIAVRSYDLRNGITDNRFGGVFFIGIVLEVVAFVVYIIINYKLLDRNDAHRKRERMFREGTLDYLTWKAKSRRMEGSIASQIATMQTINSESNAEETDQHSWLAILLIIPVVNIVVILYILYILNKFDKGHDQRWRAFGQQAQSAGQVLGMTTVFTSWKGTPDRSYFLYLILSIFTLGLFTIFWYYVLMKDVNEHTRHNGSSRTKLPGRREKRSELDH